MFTRTNSIALMAVVALLLATTCPLYAVPTSVVHQDAENADGTTRCDPLLIPTNVDEIGDAAFFPPGEELSHTGTQTSLSSCPDFDSPVEVNVLVIMTNLTGRNLTEVWYVANDETRISNYDGFANDIAFAVGGDNEALRIDHDFSDPLGKNHPLVSESGLFNGIWEAGETWEFILQDYGNLFGLPADALVSIGVGDASVFVMGAVGNSSGSIIAIPQIPEPGSAMLALLALPVMFLKRRQRK